MLRKIFIGTVLFSAMMVGVSHAQGGMESATNQATADMKAVLSLPIAISASFNQLHFGGFMPGSSEGTVVIAADQNGTREASGGVILIDASSGSSGYLNVYGEPDATYQLTFTTGPVTLTGYNEATMILSGINADTASGTFTLDANGYQTVYFGGTLAVAANQAQGPYSGTFQVTANYN